jgi:hypothetical protein
MIRKSIFHAKVGLTLTACATFLLTGCFESKEAKPKDEATVVVDKDPVNPQDNEKVVAVKKTETVNQARMQELLFDLLNEHLIRYQHSLTLNNETQKIACDLSDLDLSMIEFYQSVDPSEPVKIPEVCLSKATNRKAFERLSQEISNNKFILESRQSDTEIYESESGVKVTVSSQQTLDWLYQDFRLETADTIFKSKCSQSSLMSGSNAIEQNGLEACEPPESL